MKKYYYWQLFLEQYKAALCLTCFDSAGKAVETARYRGTGWSTRDEIEEKYKNTGYVATMECRNTNMEEWCRVLSVRKNKASKRALSSFFILKKLS